MAPDTPMPPDERAARGHLAGGAFRSGEARGRWRLLSVSWPHVVVAVQAAARAGSPDEYAFRFDLSGYPTQAPTAAPWDTERNAALAPAAWPSGAMGSRVAHAFNPNWNRSAVYLPCDRVALVGHDGWRTQYPSLLWSPDKDLTFYLGILHDLLDSDGYTGARSA